MKAILELSHWTRKQAEAVGGIVLKPHSAKFEMKQREAKGENPQPAIITEDVWKESTITYCYNPHNSDIFRYF